MNAPLFSMLCFLAAALLGAVGQFLYQSGAKTAVGGAWSYLANPRLLAGVGCYVAVMVLFVAAFKRGGAMAVLYPIYASTFIFAALISHLAYGTAIKPANVAGMVLIVLGMYLMGR